MPLPLVTALGPLSSAIAQIPVLGTLLGPFLSDVDVDLGIVLTGVGMCASLFTFDGTTS